MQDSIVARKYALALFNAALKAGKLDEVEADVSSLEAFNAGDDRFMKYMESPQVLTEAKRELLDQALKGRVSELMLRFLHLVLGKKRVDQVPGILETFHELSRAHRGIVRARVRTAVPLDAALEERMKTKLARITGKTIEVDSRVDPEILGGVVVEFENQIIDRSVRRGLDDLRDSLMKVRVL